MTFPTDAPRNGCRRLSDSIAPAAALTGMIAAESRYVFLIVGDRHALGRERP